MREIKFRAWDKYTEEMWNVETLHIEDEYVDLFKTNIYEKPLENPWAKISDVILMQYTGLKDKNGVEIYEGDIVFDRWANEYTPVFQNGIYMAYNPKHLTQNGPSTQFNVIWKDGCEVIGNIHEQED